jgi:hypothetical protein
MAIANRDELIEVLATNGVMGAARNGDLDALFAAPSTIIPAATTTVVGGVRKATAVADLAAQTVTDIAGAQTAVNAIVTKLNALLAAQRVAGQLT